MAHYEKLMSFRKAVSSRMHQREILASQQPVLTRFRDPSRRRKVHPGQCQRIVPKDRDGLQGLAGAAVCVLEALHGTTPALVPHLAHWTCMQLGVVRTHERQSPSCRLSR